MPKTKRAKELLLTILRLAINCLKSTGMKYCILISNKSSFFLFQLAVLASGVISPQLSGQGRDLTWYFGNNAAIEFRNGVAYPSTWEQKTSTAAGMLWGRDGRPLLYMTRYYTYNAGGDTIRHNPPQLFNAPECMFIRKPGSLDTIYSFQSHQHDEQANNEGWSYIEEGAFSMHRFSLNGNNGRGTVRFATDTLVMPFVGLRPIGKTSAASTLVIPHSNGRDVWFILPVCSPTEFHVYKISKSGLEKPPTVVQSSQPRGWRDTNGLLFTTNEGTYAGEIKASLDGKHFAMVAGLRGRLLYYDFDPATGAISNEREFSDSVFWQDDFFKKNLIAYSPYGLEFSPDGKLLYISSTMYSSIFDTDDRDSIRSALWQYDLTSGAADSIRSSRLTLIPLGDEHRLGGLQLGPDGKIWAVQREKNYVSCIENPNARGQACGFRKVALTFPDSAICRLGFPVMPINMLSNSLRIGSIDACLGDTMLIPLYGSFITDSVVWDFDDPSSGANSIGYGRTGKHFYNVPGAYSVSATMYVGTEAQPTVRQWVYVHERPTAQAVASHNPVCENDTVTLFSSGGVTARWYLDTTLVAEGRDVTIRPTKPATYTCIVETAFGCVDTTTLRIDTKPSPTVTVTGDTAICKEQRITLTAHGAQTYSWISGPRDYRAIYTDSTGSIQPEKTTTYFCTGVNAVGCSTTVEYVVRVDRVPDLKTNGNTTVCASVESIIGATGADKYLWIDDTGDTISTDSNLFVYPNRTTTYTVVGTSGVCTVEGTVTINVLPGPQISIIGDTMLCNEGSVVLTAKGFDNIKWLDDNNNELSRALSVEVSPTRTSTYRAISVGDTTCIDTAAHTVKVGSPPDVAVQASKNIVCIGDTVMLSASGAAQYVWSNESGNGIGTGDSVSVIVRQPSTYRVRASDSIGCTSTLSISIQTITPSSIGFGVNDTTVDVGDGYVTLPVFMSSPSAMRGATIGPIRLIITVVNKSLFVDTITGMTSAEVVPPSPDSRSIELSLNQLTITESRQEVAAIRVLPLINRDSISTITTTLLELDGVPDCEQDSIAEGRLTITGCGRKYYSGVTFVQPTTMNAYPNPVDDMLNIDIESGIPGVHTLSIIDEMGRMLYQTSFEVRLNDVGKMSERIPSHRLSAGFMCVKLHTAVGVMIRNVILVP